MKIFKLLFIVFMALVLTTGCREEATFEPQDPQSEGPAATVTQVTGNTALLKWDKITERDVAYSVWLNGKEIYTNLKETEIMLEGLNPGHKYTGKILAVDSEGYILVIPIGGFGLTYFGAIDWETNLGGNGGDYGQSVVQDPGGGYWVAGSTWEDPEGGGLMDWMIARLDDSGNLESDALFGGAGFDHAYQIEQTAGGGYIVGGNSEPPGGGADDVDSWIIRLGSTGKMVWDTQLDGLEADYFRSVTQSVDGGYLVAAEFITETMRITNPNRVVKLDANGNQQWQVSLSGKIRSVIATPEKGYAIAGNTVAPEGDPWNTDVWIVKLNASGNPQWSTILGGSGADYAYDIFQTSDGGYIAAGSSNSADGDVGGNNGGNDYWIIKLDALGNLEWETNLGGSNSDVARSVIEDSDGRYVVVGSSSSFNGDVGGNHGGSDYWIVRLDASGNLLNEHNLGGSGTDRARSVIEAHDGGYVIAGESYSSDGDVGGNNGDSDYWVVKLN